MAYQVDWEAGVITIPKADLTYLSDTAYDLDLRDFKKECWRLTWEELEGLSYPEILTYYPAIAEINQAETILINFLDYTIVFEVGNYLVTMFGAGTNVYNYVVMNGVSVRSSGGVAVTVDGGASSDIGYIEQRIYVDTESAVDGDGTQANPFNNIVSGKDFLESSGLKIIVLSGDVVIPNNLKNVTIIGVGLPTVDTNGMDLKGTKFYQVKIKGDYINSIIVQESLLLDGFTLDGTFEKCAIYSELLPKGASVTLKDCFNGNSEFPTVINLGLSISGTKLIVDSFGGDITIKSSINAVNNSKIRMSNSTVIFDATNTDGDMEATGASKLIDNTVGKLVVDNTLFRENIAEAIASYTKL